MLKINYIEKVIEAYTKEYIGVIESLKFNNEQKIENLNNMFFDLVKFQNDLALTKKSRQKIFEITYQHYINSIEILIINILNDIEVIKND